MIRWRRCTLLLVALVLVLLTVRPAPSLAADGRDRDYLALGDSVTFGFNPLLDRADAANFVGYPEVLADMLDLHVTNASCPGEASGGFIALTGIDNSCRAYRAAFPLHAGYSTAQLDFAVAYLRSHPRTRLVTITIGANDLFILQRQCAGARDCVVQRLPALLETLAANLATIYTRLRVEATYRHELVALTYYAQEYNDPTAVAVIGAVNRVVTGVTQAYGGTVADGFGAFQAAAAGADGDSCAAGLLIRLPQPGAGCDIHPSPVGRDLLAHAILQALGGSPAACSLAPLGVATPFNVFVLGDVTHSSTATAGRLAAGGRATLTNYSVGGVLTPAAATGDTLVVGGALTLTQGSVATGNAVSGGPATLANVAFAPGAGYRQGTPLDFAAAGSTLRARSTAAAGLPAGGTTRVEYGQITLTGTDPGLNVFTVAGADLAGANSLTVQVPAGATALVNVSGATARLQYLGFSLRGVGRQQVLYHFPEATTLTLEGVGVEGSILAPRAAIAFNNGIVQGTLVGASLTGTGQATEAPFRGCLAPRPVGDEASVATAARRPSRPFPLLGLVRAEAATPARRG